MFSHCEHKEFMNEFLNDKRQNEEAQDDNDDRSGITSEEGLRQECNEHIKICQTSKKSDVNTTKCICIYIYMLCMCILLTKRQ